MSKVNQRWRFSYTETTEAGDTLIDLDINFENVSDELLIRRLETFLRATGRDGIAKIEDI
jgi:hypothetical protein